MRALYRIDVKEKRPEPGRTARASRQEEVLRKSRGLRRDSLRQEHVLVKLHYILFFTQLISVALPLSNQTLDRLDVKTLE
jgi:hypothetical protein